MDAPADKHARILDAATDLIVESGLQFPMSTIAAKADVAMGSVYKYFASKDDLILAVYARLAAEINAALVHNIVPEEDARDRVMRYIYEYIDCFWSDADRATLFEYLSNVPLIPAAEFNRLFNPVNTYNFRIVELAQTQGCVRTGPPNVMAGYIGGGIRNMLKWHRKKSADLTEVDRELVASMSWDAISAAGNGR